MFLHILCLIWTEKHGSELKELLVILGRLPIHADQQAFIHSGFYTFVLFADLKKNLISFLSSLGLNGRQEPK